MAMSYNTSNRTGQQSAALGNAIAGLLVAGVTFVLGYTVVRASLAQNAASAADVGDEIAVVVPHEGTLWAGFGTEF